jgi:multidrug efflux pump subunit AcrA (membrane-fusion protein)
MKRSHWIVAFLVVVGGFAGFQQYQSWSLNKPQGDSTAKPPVGAEGGSGASRGQGEGRTGGGQGQQGRGGGGRARGGEAVPVLVATATQKAVPLQIRAVGNVEPYTTVSVKSQVTGALQQAHFKEGQDVKKGQLLFTVDPTSPRSGTKTGRSQYGA